jgi:hypothetical protein
LVFAIAGVANLSDRKEARQALVDFGVPSSLASSLGIILPITELVMTVALILLR